MQNLLVNILFVVFAIVASLAEAQETSQHPTGKMGQINALLEEGEAPLTVDQINEIVKELIPLVEDAVGRKFKQAPKIKIVNRAEIPKVLAGNEIPRPVRRQGEHRKRDTKRAGKTTKMMEMATLGLYGIGDKVLYLMPRNVYPILKFNRIDEKYAPAIFKLIIAHELVHAIQDQELNLSKKYLACYDYEASEALLATTEGHAVFIQEKIAANYQLDQVSSEFYKLLTGKPIKIDNPMLEMSIDATRNRLELVYLAGLKFIEHHYKEGGRENLGDSRESTGQHRYDCKTRIIRFIFGKKI